MKASFFLFFDFFDFIDFSFDFFFCDFFLFFHFIFSFCPVRTEHTPIDLTHTLLVLPNQTQPNQTKPNQTKPNQTKPTKQYTTHNNTQQHTTTHNNTQDTQHTQHTHNERRTNTHTQTNKQTSKQTNKQTNTQTHTHKRTNERTNRQTNKQTTRTTTMGSGANPRDLPRAGLFGARCHADLASSATPHFAGRPLGLTPGHYLIRARSDVRHRLYSCTVGVGAWSKVVLSGTKTARPQDTVDSSIFHLPLFGRSTQKGAKGCQALDPVHHQ